MPDYWLPKTGILQWWVRYPEAIRSVRATLLTQQTRTGAWSTRKCLGFRLQIKKPRHMFVAGLSFRLFWRPLSGYRTAIAVYVSVAPVTGTEAPFGFAVNTPPAPITN